MKCDKCGKDTFLPFTCPYCGRSFCSEHRLPENHEDSKVELARLSRTDAYPAIAETPQSFEHRVTFSPDPPKKRRILFGRGELWHLLLAAVLVVGVGISIAYSYVEDFDFVLVPLFSAMFAASFFIHEFAHKIIAQKGGFRAEFRLTLFGAVLTLISIFSPVKFISPGAVMISGFADHKSMGKIAVGGPVTNVLLCLGFLSGLLLFPIFHEILVLGMALNAWIALFNLIPFGIFDGLKVFNWDRRIWVLMFVASLGLTVFSYIALFGLVL
jgi:Zn-dependent protease